MSPSRNTGKSHFRPYQPPPYDFETGRPPKSSEPPDRLKTDTRNSVISFDREPYDQPADFDCWKGSWHWNIRTDETFWSEQLYRITGREKATIPSFKEHFCFYTTESWIRLADATLGLLKTGTPFELRLQMRHTDSTRRWVVCKGEAVRNERGEIVELRGTIQDIGRGMPQVENTEGDWQTRSNPEDATRRLVQAQEDQNAELAMELRDNICQRMSLLAVEIQGFSSTLSGTFPQPQTKLDSFWQETTGILAELDRMSDRLYPFVLDLLGLPMAMRRLCREFTRQHSIPVQYSCSPLPENRLDKQSKLVLYRILEDILTNVGRHSGANKVTVSLDHDPVELRLRVSDNGVGFGEARAKTPEGFGFARIRTQIARIEGNVAMWSQHPCGTLIEVRAPLTVRSNAVLSRRSQAETS